MRSYSEMGRRGIFDKSCWQYFLSYKVPLQNFWHQALKIAGKLDRMGILMIKLQNKSCGKRLLWFCC